MQFLAHHNAPQNYNNLVESNVIQKDDYNEQIHKPYLAEIAQSNRQFHTDYTTKTTHDQFDYSQHTLDNFSDPVHNDTVAHHSNFISNRNSNPYRNGDAQQFFNYNPNLPYTQPTPPYANNYGTYDSSGYWDPYINPQKNVTNYLTQQVVKNSDRNKMIDRNRNNLNSVYPRDINPYDNFVKDFNPGDNFVTGDSNHDLSSGNDLPLNKLIPAANKNVPPDAPPGINTNIPILNEAYDNVSGNGNIMEQSLNQILKNLGEVSIDTVNDVVRWAENDNKDMNQLWNIFTRPGKMTYIGILVIILAILLMILL